MITEKMRLDWIEQNVNYLEHGSIKDRDLYWPQTSEDYEIDPESPYLGLTLLEYIDARLSETLKVAA
jgi:hypothetical protein